MTEAVSVGSKVPPWRVRMLDMELAIRQDHLWLYALIASHRERSKSRPVPDTDLKSNLIITP